MVMPSLIGGFGVIQIQIQNYRTLGSKYFNKDSCLQNRSFSTQRSFSTPKRSFSTRSYLLQSSEEENRQILQNELPFAQQEDPEDESDTETENAIEFGSRSNLSNNEKESSGQSDQFDIERSSTESGSISSGRFDLHSRSDNSQEAGQSDRSGGDSG